MKLTIALLASLLSPASSLSSFRVHERRSSSRLHAITQLEQLTSMDTVISIDTGDLDLINDLAKTGGTEHAFFLVIALMIYLIFAGLVSDATTNPLFVSQAGLSGDPRSVL